LYAVFLARSLAPTSIPGYLNIIKLMHAEKDLSNPLDNWELRAVTKGIHRSLGRPPKQKLPITPDILAVLYTNLDLSNPQLQAFWAACLVGFFAFLRKSTLLPKTSHIKDSVKALTMGDLELHPDKSLLTLHIRHTKTIQFGQRELLIPISAVQGSFLCPVMAIIRMLSSLPAGNVSKLDPLFSYSNSEGVVSCLTHSTFLRILKSTLTAGGIKPADYSGHSFRRGGCTHAFQLGVSPQLIKLRGDWRSNAFERYIDIQFSQHVLFAKALGISVAHK
jgi:hypothetical protein